MVVKWADTQGDTRRDTQEIHGDERSSGADSPALAALIDQLAKKDEQIAKLMETVADSTKAVQGAQALHHETAQTLALLTASPSAAAPPGFLEQKGKRTPLLPTEKGARRQCITVGSPRLRVAPRLRLGGTRRRVHEGASPLKLPLWFRVRGSAPPCEGVAESPSQTIPESTFVETWARKGSMEQSVHRPLIKPGLFGWPSRQFRNP